jgi:hypothetical protein
MEPRPPVNPEVSDDESLTERMMRMIVSLRKELYDLYARHTKLTEDYLVLKKEVKITPIQVPEILPENNAVSTTTSGEIKPVLCGDAGDGTQALQAPAPETDGGKADAGDV